MESSNQQSVILSCPCLLYLLKLTITLRLSRDPQQLFFMFLDLLLETHILLTHHSLKLQQLGAKIQQGRLGKSFA